MSVDDEHAEEDELTPEQLEHVRGLLEHRRQEAQQELETAKDDAQPVNLDLSIGRLTRVDALQQQQMAAARRRRLEAQLAQIQQAFSRIEHGTFGECIHCDEPIGFRRLKVRPEAPMCLRCQEGTGA